MGASVGITSTNEIDPFPTTTIGGCVEINEKEFVLLPTIFFKPLTVKNGHLETIGVMAFRSIPPLRLKLS